jgi:hypothetical protein
MHSFISHITFDVTVVIRMKWDFSFCNTNAFVNGFFNGNARLN